MESLLAGGVSRARRDTEADRRETNDLGDKLRFESSLARFVHAIDNEI